MARPFGNRPTPLRPLWGDLLSLIRTIPAETFGKVTARFGGRIRYIALGRRVIIAWHLKEHGR